MNETKFTKPRLRLDDQGRALPFTDEERKAQVEAIRLMFEELKAMPDDPSEASWSEVFRAIDSHRPHRPLFEGLY